MGGRGVFRILHREIRGLHEAAYVLALFTFGSQIFALVRDRLFAHTFGAGSTLDLFYAAFRIPDTLYALLASVVSLFVLIPFLERAGEEGKDGVRQFLSDMFSFFSGALILVAGCAWVFAPQLVRMLYAGFDPVMHTQLVPLVRVLLLQPLLLGISNLFAAYVQMRGRFMLYAVAPILYNVGIIVGVLFFYPVWGPVGLAWGVVLGAVLHLGIQTPYIVSSGVLPRLTVPEWWRVWEVVRLSIPRTITLSAQQLVTLVLVSIASYFAVGSISSFTFAWNLQAVPLAIIGVSYSVAAFPKLARLYGNGDRKEYATLIVTAARQIIFWAMPVTVLFVVLRAQIVRVILGTGAFDWSATMQTGAVLALLSVSLVAQGLVVLLVRACYAAGKTMVPLVLNVGSSIATVALAFGLLGMAKVGLIDLGAFEHLMRVPSVHGGEILLLALAYSLGSFVNVILMIIYFERRIDTFIGQLAHTGGMSLVASLCAGVVAYLTLNVVDGMVSLQTTMGVFLQGLVAGVAGMVAWVLSLMVFKSEDLRVAYEALHRRLLRARLSATQGSIGES
ncbi:MAG: murein biosynthesis integral membrane protein MurJ [Candidatus Pacebacteria bacterium]|nr:murein biosynthesis integral membrane protein MurJ [Candidatus Paceibacterota bacterium]